jgi:hypothetical protein
MLPDAAYAAINEDELELLTVAFCKEFQNLFGIANAFYNLHLVSHLPAIRKRKGVLTDYTCYTFESFYSVIKKTQVPGTTSLSKQSFTGVFAGHLANNPTHTCQQGIKLRSTATSKADDTLIAYGVSKFLRIERVHGNYVTGKVIETRDFTPQLTADLYDWQKIGVRIMSQESRREKTIRKDKIYGKAVLCHGVITSVPINVLRAH